MSNCCNCMGYHEQNLDWLMEEMLRVINEWAEVKKENEDFTKDIDGKIVLLEKNFADLKTYVDNYFTNLDIQDEVNNRLEQMYQDGRLETIIYDLLKPGYINVVSPPDSKYTLDNTGSTDNSTKFQNLLDDLKTLRCHTLIFPEGSYLFNSQINIPENTKIIGLNAKIKVTKGIEVAWWISGNNVEINGLSFNTNAKCIYVSLSKNVKITDCEFSTIATAAGQFQYAISFSHSTDLLVRDCLITNPLSVDAETYNNSDGIHINGGCKNIIIENVVGYAGDDFIALNAAEPITNPGNIENVFISNVSNIYNDTEGDRGVRLYSTGQTIRNVTIRNCNFHSKGEIRTLMITNSPSQDGNNAGAHCIVEGLLLENVSLSNEYAGIRTSYSDITDLIITNCDTTALMVDNNDSSIDLLKISNLQNKKCYRSASTANIKHFVVLDCGFTSINCLNTTSGIVEKLDIIRCLFNGTNLSDMTSTSGTCKYVTLKDCEFTGVINPIFYFSTEEIKLIGNVYGTGLRYIASIPTACKLLIAENNSYADVPTDRNTITNFPSTCRFKGFDIQCTGSGGTPIHGDHFIQNVGGTFTPKIYLNNKWNTIVLS